MKTTGALPLLTCVLALSFVGCTRSQTAPRASAQPGDPAAPSTPDAAAPPAVLVRSAWLVQDIAGRSTIGDSRVSIRFDPSGRISGDTGVNTFTGAARFSGQNFTPGPLASTRRAGPEALMDQEQRFLTALGSATAWQIDNTGTLRLHAAAGEALLRCSPMPTAAAEKSNSAAAGK